MLCEVGECVRLVSVCGVRLVTWGFLDLANRLGSRSSRGTPFVENNL